VHQRNHDARAVRVVDAGIADIVFVGDRNEIEAVAQKSGIDLSG